MRVIIQVNGGNAALAAGVYAASWRDSHAGFCSAAFVARHTAGHWEAVLRAVLQAGKRVSMRVAGRPVGIVSVYESLIEGLYVLPEEQRRGEGAELLLFAMGQCPEAPTLWVLEHSRGARALYVKHGFQATGRRKQLSGSLAEIEMTRRHNLPAPLGHNTI